MDTKEELKFNIKGYLEYDRKIKRLQNEIKLLKAEQKKASYNLMDIMRSNDIDCFDLNEGRLMYKKNSVKKAIGKKYLLTILSKYFNGDEDKVNDLNEFIHMNRESVERETIVMKDD
jgi:hypothetical protein